MLLRKCIPGHNSHPFSRLPRNKIYRINTSTLAELNGNISDPELDVPNLFSTRDQFHER